jgi:hypothetical protein
MAEEKQEDYGIEPAAASPEPADEPTLRRIDVPRTGDSQPLPLEHQPPSAAAPSRPVPRDDSQGPSSVKELDVCPNCGASMRGADTLVCLRCGFDLKTMRVIKTATGETTAPVETDEQAGRPLVEPGMGDLWLPGALAGISGLLLLIGYLAGARGLFPQLDAEAEIGVTKRFEGILQLIVLLGMWTACGLAGLIFLANMLGKRTVKDLSDFKLAAMRMLGIVTAAHFVAFINFSSAPVEFVVEAILHLAIFAGLSILLFRLKPRDGLTLTGASLVAFFVLWMCAKAIHWATV